MEILGWLENEDVSRAGKSKIKAKATFNKELAEKSCIRNENVTAA